jgi:hypothetical protein
VRYAYLIVGATSLLLGGIGIFLPLLPTVPFVILAAFCFARSNPAWERRLLEHPRFGGHIRAWRTRGAISRRGKLLGIASLTASAVAGLMLLDAPTAYIPAAVALISGTWIATRPDS